MEGHSVANAISYYYDKIQKAAFLLGAEKRPSSSFQPNWELPPLTTSINTFYKASTLSWGSAGDYRGNPISLLDLTGNPGCGTVKTFGSALIVARALQHIATTGEPVMLFTASAANKAVALRDAVLRAYETGCATPQQLRVAAIVPASSWPKLWDSPLLSDLCLAAANPIGIYAGHEREDVKKLATAAVAAASDEIRKNTAFRVWYTLDPRNYMVADVVRAFYEREWITGDTGPRWHAHAVSSAYGILGHNLGVSILEEENGSSSPPASYLLVQHLETPDLVLNFHPDEADDYAFPAYHLESGTGLYRQHSPIDPHFPAVCYHPAERLERTFYTRQPVTTPEVRKLMRQRGGDGIVVSLPECLDRYQEVRELVAKAGMTRLPVDPRMLWEWAMVMAAVGVLTAIDRGLVPDDAHIVLHGSGAYSEGEFSPPVLGQLSPVESAESMVALLRGAAEVK